MQAALELGIAPPLTFQSESSTGADTLSPNRPGEKSAGCGINPHAGESGLSGYGEEEAKIARPSKRVE